VAKTKIKKTQPAKPEARHQPSAPERIVPAQEAPSPGILLQMAEDEPNRRELMDYRDVIRVLRDEKKFTFREIAEWLGERGVVADHNAVYREYTRCMPPQYAQEEAVADDLREREEAGQL